MENRITFVWAAVLKKLHFRIDPNKWTIAEGEWHKTAKQGAEFFMTK